ncbi:MAG: SAM-dependent methyltransferase, partial [Curvibacter sp.]
MVSSMEAALTPWVAQLKDRANLPVLLQWGEHPVAGSGLRLGDFEQARVVIKVRKAAAVPTRLDPSLDSLVTSA